MTPDDMYLYCPKCGTRYANLVWARTCTSCNLVTFRNPKPVVALLVPVDDGLVVVRRNIEPKAGMLTFPGGYVDYGESWQQAAVRELREEACIEIPPDEVRVFDVISTSKGHMVTIFGIVHSRRESELPEFVPNAESSERMIIRDVVELAFPQDNELLRKYFCR